MAPPAWRKAWRGAAPKAPARCAPWSSYLSEGHLVGCEGGCPISALASEMPRQSPEVRDISASRVTGLVGVVQQALPADAGPHAAMAITSSLVGAMQLARALGDNAQGHAMLAAARQSILDQYDSEGRQAAH